MSQGAYSSLGSRHHRLQPEPRIPPPPLLPPAIADFVSGLPPIAEWPTATLDYLFLRPLRVLLIATLEIITSPRTHRLILRLGVLSTIFWTALGLAIAAYVGFYRAWVPDIGIRRNVWLQYGWDEPPFAEFALMPRDARDGSRLFAQGQEYDVTLDLSVPLSAANLDLGNFMVSLDLFDESNHTIMSTSRPTMITFEPLPLRALHSLTHQLTRPGLSLPTSNPPTQLLSVPLLSRQVLQPASTSHPFAPHAPSGVTRARVSVGRRDAEKYWKYGGGHGVGGVVKESGGQLRATIEGFRSRGELQTHAVSLRFDAHLVGLRFFMYHYPLLSFLLFTTLFLSFELLAALTLWAVAALYTSSLTQESLAVEDNYLDGRGVGRRARRGGRERGGDSSTSATEGTYGQGRFAGDTATEQSTPYSEDGERGRRYGDEEDDGEGTETETEEIQRARRSLESLRARDEEERREALRAEQRRDVAEGRRMTAADAPPVASREELVGTADIGLPMGRRVLGRLDEETEEETDVGSTRGRSDVEAEDSEGGAGGGGWEDIGRGSGQLVGDEEEDEEERERRAGLRRRVKSEEEERESTVGGSATSRATSSVRSFGASSYGGRTATTGTTSIRPSQSPGFTPTPPPGPSSSSSTPTPGTTPTTSRRIKPEPQQPGEGASGLGSPETEQSRGEESGESALSGELASEESTD